MKTLEQYFRENWNNQTIDFALRIHHVHGEGVTFYLHPSGKDGATPNFTVKGNTLERGGPGIIEPEDEPNKMRHLTKEEEAAFDRALWKSVRIVHDGELVVPEELDKVTK